MFAQEPLFALESTTMPNTANIESENLILLREAAARPGVSSVGSAPYVESTRVRASRNMEHVLDLSATLGLHVDFHLDYARPHVDVDVDLDADMSADTSSMPMIWELLDRLKTWKGKGTVCVGHATLLTAFSSSSWARFRTLVSSPPLSHLRITLISLPPSDLYMMGCTLDVADLKERLGISAAMAVNNVGNAFGPRGCVDPLEAVVGLEIVVGGKGTEKRWEALLVCAFVHPSRSIRTDLVYVQESVTTTARNAIGIDRPTRPLTDVATNSMHDRNSSFDSRGRTLALDIFPYPGQPADFVILWDNITVRDVALAPSYDRTTIKNGRVVARRWARRWIMEVSCASKASTEPNYVDRRVS